MMHRSTTKQPPNFGSKDVRLRLDWIFKLRFNMLYDASPFGFMEIY